MKRLRKFSAISWGEKMLFIEALLLQLGVGLLLKVVPFRRIPRLFANPETLSPHSPHITADDIKRATQRAGRISPWRNRCLVQSLAARCMLRRRKTESELSLGVILDHKSKMTAHAWISVGGVEIVEKGGDYRELFRF